LSKKATVKGCKAYCWSTSNRRLILMDLAQKDLK